MWPGTGHIGHHYCQHHQTDTWLIQLQVSFPRETWSLEDVKNLNMSQTDIWLRQWQKKQQTDLHNFTKKQWKYNYLLLWAKHCCRNATCCWKMQTWYELLQYWIGTNLVNVALIPCVLCSGTFTKPLDLKIKLNLNLCNKLEEVLSIDILSTL